MGNPIGNEANMEQVRALMNKGDQIGMGGELHNAVPLDYKSEYGEHYTGLIEFKRPTVQDYMRMGAIKAQLLGAYGAVNRALLDGTVLMLAEAIATLEVLTVTAPPWLIKGGKLDFRSIEEPNLVFYMYGAFQDWEASFRTDSDIESEGDSEPSEAAGPVETSETV